MKPLSLFILLILIISCDSSTKSPEPDETKIDRIVKLPNGTYNSSCLYEAERDLKYTIRLDVNNDAVKVRYTLHKTTACTTDWWYYDSEYNIEKSIYDGSSSEEILLDLSVTSIRYKFNNSWYPKQHYCGLTNWTTTSEKEMAGVACPEHEKLSTCTTHTGKTESLNERPDKLIRSVGHKVYLKVKYFEDRDVIEFPANDDSKGDTSTQRFGISGDEDNIFELTKLTPVN